MNRTLICALAAAVAISGGCSRPADPQIATGSEANDASMEDSAQSEPAAAALVSVPAGTLVHVRLDTSLNSGRSRAGDDISATVAQDVIVAGQRAIPAGSTVSGVVRAVSPAKRGAGNASMTLAFNRLSVKGGSSMEIVAGLSQRSESKKKRNAAIIGGSAAGGALLGRIIGKDTKGAVVGAIAGGAVGTGVVMSKEGEQVRLPAGTEMTIKLNEPISVPA